MYIINSVEIYNSGVTVNSSLCYMEPDLLASFSKIPATP